MRNGWTYEEKLCYIAHTWAEKERQLGYGILEGFDHTDIAIAAKVFIKGYTAKVDFKEYRKLFIQQTATYSERMERASCRLLCILHSDAGCDVYSFHPAGFTR